MINIGLADNPVIIKIKGPRCPDIKGTKRSQYRLDLSSAANPARKSKPSHYVGIIVGLCLYDTYWQLFQHREGAVLVFI
jgi:hypothetical protein